MRRKEIIENKENLKRDFESKLIDAVIEYIPFEFYALNKNQEYILENSVCKKNWGDLIGKSVLSIDVDKNILELWLKNNQRALSGESIDEEIEIVKNGRKVLYRNIIAPFTIHNEIEGLMGINIDITVPRRVQKELLESERNFREIFEAASDMIFRINMDSNIISVNPACYRILGYDLDEFTGFPFNNFILDEDKESIDRILNIYKTSKFTLSPISFETKMLRKNRKIITVELNCRILKRDNKIIGLLAIGRDVTDRKLIEEERLRSQKFSSIGILAGGIAHDFNNILTAILGNINMLEYTEFTKDQKELINALKTGAYRAVDLTKQLLTFSKAPTPKKVIQSVVDIVKESEKLIMRGSKSKCIFFIDDGIPSVKIDPGQISQVINNLLINADQSMPNGGIINIEITKERVDNLSKYRLRPDTYVRITIKDHGIGIPKENQQKVFEPYFTTKENGNGLGLATCYSIIRTHNGYITFNSEEGEGTEFIVYLPVTYEIAIQKELVETAKFNQNYKILVLDDEKSVHDILKRMLHRLNLEMDSAFTGDQLLEKYKKSISNNKPFDLVILDLTIPGGVGAKEIIKELRKINPEINSILTSGYYNDPVVVNYKEYGFNGVLKKPYTLDQVKMLLSSIFS